MATPTLSTPRGRLLGRPLVMIVLLCGVACTEPDATLYRLFNYEQIETDPRLGPISAELVSPMSVLAIPEQIGAPSGISYQPDLEQFAIVTDDNELFILNDSLSNIESDAVISHSSEVEGVAFLNEARLAAVSEQGDILFFDRSGQQWTLEQIELRRWDKNNWSHVFGSAAYEAQTQQLITGVKVGINELYHVDLDGSLAETVRLAPADQLVVTAADELSRYTIVGLTASEGALYLLSEQYNTVLRLLDGKIDHAWGLQGVGEVSGLTVKDGLFYVLGDFEEGQQRPPVYVFSLEP